MDSELIVARLAEPFPPERTHWRVGATNAKKLGVKPWEATKGKPLAYIDARDVMDRLDEVVGSHRWEDYYTETASGRVICKLTVYFGDDVGWITKSDGAGDTGTEGEKGAISDALKRAAVKFGVGRYLYGIKSGWIDLDKGQIPHNWNGAALLPKYTDRLILHNAAWIKHEDSITAIRGFVDEDKIAAAWEAWNEIPEADQMALKVAPTKGGWMRIKDKQALIEGAKQDFDAEAGVYRSIANKGEAA